MCLGTPHSHIPSRDLYNKGIGGVDQMDCLFTRTCTVGGPRQKFVGHRPLRLCPGPQHDHSHFLVPCEIEENPLSHLIFRREVIMLSQDGSTHNQLHGHRLVEENLPLWQMESRETVMATNSKQAAMQLKKEMQSVEWTIPMPKVRCKDLPWQESTRFERHHAGRQLRRKHSQTPASLFLAWRFDLFFFQAKNKLAGVCECFLWRIYMCGSVSLISTNLCWKSLLRGISKCETCIQKLLRQDPLDLSFGHF